MLRSRRKVLKTGGGAGVLALLFAAGVARPGDILAQSGNPSAFTMKTVPEAMRALGAQNPELSGAIQIKAPEIATRYRTDAGAEPRLAAKVKAGGQGVWGNVPMPPHPQIDESEARALIRWILTSD